MKSSPLVLLAFVASSLRGELTLQEYARGKVLTVQTVTKRVDVKLAEDDQTNNLVEGDQVLSFSGLGLSSLDGIAHLRVAFQGRETELSDVPKLHLFLNRNSLRGLPAEFVELRNVIFLYCNFNQFDDIPPGIARMQGLLGMYFTGNRLTRIAPEVFTMTWLRKLQVSKNRIEELPAALGELQELRHLNVSGNRIQQVPDGIANLTKLRVCDLSANRIGRLPTRFGNVAIVHQLRVGDNPLEALPSGFANMPGTIDITGTKIRISQLPPALRAKISRDKHPKDKDDAEKHRR